MGYQTIRNKEEGEGVKIKQSADVPTTNVQVEGAAGVKIQWLIDKEDKPENFCMRLFEIEPGGHTPLHGHPWEHEVFVLEGEGNLVTQEGEEPLVPETVVYVPSNADHQFRNSGQVPLKFICLVPKNADY